MPGLEDASWREPLNSALLLEMVGGVNRFVVCGDTVHCSECHPSNACNTVFVIECAGLEPGREYMCCDHVGWPFGSRFLVFEAEIVYAPACTLDNRIDAVVFVPAIEQFSNEILFRRYADKQAIECWGARPDAS